GLLGEPSHHRASGKVEATFDYLRGWKIVFFVMAPPPERYRADAELGAQLRARDEIVQLGFDRRPWMGSSGYCHGGLGSSLHSGAFARTGLARLAWLGVLDNRSDLLPAASHVPPCYALSVHERSAALQGHEPRCPWNLPLNRHRANSTNSETGDACAD